MKKVGVFLLLLVLSFFVQNSSSFSATVDVTMREFSFNPLQITINTGDTVRWTNSGVIQHTTTSGANCVSDGKWDSGFLSPGQTFSFTFTSPGTFPYFCAMANHCSAFGMIGTVTVVNPAAPPAPDIRANNTKGTITIRTTDVLLITASLNAGSSLGTNADWWVAAETPFGFYHWDSGSSPWQWQAGLAVTFQGALVNVPETQIFNVFALTPGTYIFYFAVDDVVDGQVTYDRLFFDSVVINVTQ
ncbi:MAG: plastocyanin/azurin family copper-binding protein [Nitrospirota bacterium]